MDTISEQLRTLIEQNPNNDWAYALGILFWVGLIVIGLWVKLFSWFDSDDDHSKN